MIVDVVVIGAGVAGLSCAKELVRAGKTVRIVERARGVGGRCATRRVDGQSVDHGLVFLHGNAPDFVQALSEVPGISGDTWPTVIHGNGSPCQPNAFGHGSRRISHPNGVSTFPKHLARGLDIALETTVKGLESAADGITIIADQRGEPVSFVGRAVVLALAGPQTRSLLERSLPSRKNDSARALLAMVPSVPCATVIAVYSLEAGCPPWDVWYPETSKSLLVMCHDSAKRDNPAYRVLVFQARPAWSNRALSLNEAQWAPELLKDAATLVGSWVTEPVMWQTHIWRHARTSPDAELADPLLLELEGNRRLGIAGELFASGGGVQAAWLSGRRLARRLIDEEKE